MKILNWYEPEISTPTLLTPNETRTISESLYIDLIPNTDFYDLLHSRLKNSISFDFWNLDEENLYETDN